jgi:hypothetical protein
MPDAIDDAARAFQTEIAPGERPRGADGRFERMQESRSAPEPIFQERRIEGDPLTGDVRDGGEDRRLAEIERRVADGRSEQGDAEELSQAAAKTQRQGRERSISGQGEERDAAAADEGHEGTENVEARVDDLPKPQEAGGEGDQRLKFKVTTLEGEPVEKFEVTVDGRPAEVTLEEALDGYIKDATFKVRISQVADARRAIETQAAEVGQWRDVYVQRLQALDRELQELTPPEPDWDREFAADPRSAHEKQKAYALIHGKRQQIANEMSRANQEAKAEYDRNIQQYAVHQFEEFVTDNGFRDKKALDEDLSLMREYAKKEGFSEAETATVYDKRMLTVLRKAALYDRLMGQKIKPVITGQGRTLIPGVAAPVGNATRRHIDDAQTRLARSGSVEDAALVMSRLIR